ncbi:MAG: pyridoxal phosphate-dependent aminotransferase [Bifidobacteriaceae bacterium]|jgi:cystathionine beta-lyase|nr:pyridoxal phosphate-dependent aminotransferase [Bifidobacteriaceae bacterium]
MGGAGAGAGAVGGAVPPSEFDRVVDRAGTDAIAVDHARYGKDPGLLPMWVADMGFRAPEPVRAALAERAEHGIFGYSDAGDGYFEALTGWFAARHGWKIDPAHVRFTPGVVAAIHIALNALTDPGDSIIIQPPVYYPFAAAIRATGRRVAANPLRRVGETGRYEIDFEGFEAQARQARLFILCNPHNPVGRVWSAPDLLRLGRICARHGVIVIADEVHADFVYPGARHQVFAALDPEFEQMAVTCTAPSKTFNLAGLQLANIVIADPGLRGRFRETQSRAGFGHPPATGLVAARAAYASGGPWVDALVQYIWETMAFLANQISERVPGVAFRPPEGTYLAWLDCAGLGLDPDRLEAWVQQRAGLWLDDGRIFGEGGAGFQRLNTAFPRSVIAEAVDRLAAAAR